MNFFNKNQLGLGLLFGVIIPFVAYALLMMINERIFEAGNLGADGSQPIFDNNSLLLFAICFNLIPFTYYQRKRFSKSMRGILGATLIYAMVWLFWFSSNF